MASYLNFPQCLAVHQPSHLVDLVPKADIGETAYEAAYAQRRLGALNDAAKSLGYTLNPQPATDASGVVSG